MRSFATFVLGVVVGSWMRSVGAELVRAFEAFESSAERMYDSPVEMQANGDYRPRSSQFPRPRMEDRH